MKIEAGHPHHTSKKGMKGGSLPSVNNDHIGACGEILRKAQGEAGKLKEKFPNPVTTRLKK